MDVVGCNDDMTVWAAAFPMLANPEQKQSIYHFGLYNYSYEVEVYMAA